MLEIHPRGSRCQNLIPFYSWILLCPTDRPHLLIHLSTDRHLGCIHFPLVLIGEFVPDAIVWTEHLHGINELKLSSLMHVWSKGISESFVVGVMIPSSFSEGLGTFFYYLRFYLFERERERENVRMSRGEEQREREKQIPHWAVSQIWGSVPRPRDHDLSRRQVLNWLSHSGTKINDSFIQCVLLST